MISASQAITARVSGEISHPPGSPVSIVAGGAPARPSRTSRSQAEPGLVGCAGVTGEHGGEVGGQDEPGGAAVPDRQGAGAVGAGGQGQLSQGGEGVGGALHPGPRVGPELTRRARRGQGVQGGVQGGAAGRGEHGAEQPETGGFLDQVGRALPFQRVLVPGELLGTVRGQPVLQTEGGFAELRRVQAPPAATSRCWASAQVVGSTSGILSNALHGPGHDGGLPDPDRPRSERLARVSARSGRASSSASRARVRAAPGVSGTRPRSHAAPDG